MSRELEIRLIKEEMEMMTKGGKLPPDQIVEITLRKLVSMNVPAFEQAYKEWELKKKEIEIKGQELEQEYNKIIEKYYKSIQKLENSNGFGPTE